jgi:uncharacterized protein
MSRRLRIVIDTNVVISAALKPAGLEAQLIELIAHRVFELYVSAEVLAEYRGVFNRPKFARIPPERVSRLLALIAAEATKVTPTKRLQISSHDDDNRFLECAEAAKADYLVTGNNATSQCSGRPPKSSTAVNCSKPSSQQKIKPYFLEGV